MKKERKLKLEVNRISISRLNNVKGGGYVTSVDFPCIISLDNYSCIGICQTGLTVLDGSVAKNC